MTFYKKEILKGYFIEIICNGKRNGVSN